VATLALIAATIKVIFRAEKNKKMMQNTNTKSVWSVLIIIIWTAEFPRMVKPIE
jgi:hypothetical protein